jgi:hypothetical protein
MNIIRTWEELAKALASPHHPAVHQILTDTRDRLEEFNDQPLSELCTILLLQPPDTLAALEQALGFPFEPTQAEYISRTDGWWELVFVTGDDGFGFVVLIEDRPDADRALLSRLH